MSARGRVGWRCWAALPLTTGVLLCVALGGCPGRPDPPDLTDSGTAVHGLEVREVRVLLGGKVSDLRFRVRGGYTVRADSGPVQKLRGGAEEIPIANRNGLTLSNRLAANRQLEIAPSPSQAIELSLPRNGRWAPAVRYAGSIRILAHGSDQLRVINLVDLETYVAGVLTRELYSDFHAETFRAQAVAARTYAMHQMARHARRDYDVTAGEGSQVYGGLPHGPAASKALDAVRHTRGIVATWTASEGEKIFCTYYSSCCGGCSQDVANCKPVPSIPPLRGGVRCDYCRIAKGKVYRWGPVRLAKRELTEKLSRRYPALTSKLGQVATVQVAAWARNGRPKTIRLVGTTGRTHDLVAENFRLAVGSRLMRSTDCRILDQGDYLEFTEGRGFGHGIGLCQWGAQGQALRGRKAAAILKFYYPGMHLTRAY